MTLRAMLPIAVFCSLLGACASGGGKAPAAQETAPVAAAEAPKAAQKAAPKTADKPATPPSDAPATPTKTVAKKQKPVPTAQPQPAPTAQPEPAPTAQPEPAPTAEQEPKFEVNTPQEPYYDQPPPSQPRKPAPAKPEATKPEVALPEPVHPPVAPAAPAAPALVKQPDAIAILERARKELAGVRTLDCVTITEATGEAANTMPNLGIRNRVQLRFQYDDAVSIPFFVITRIIETPTGEAYGPRSVYDGKRAVIIDDASKTFVDPGRNWFDVVGANLSAIPQWFFKERMTLARRKPGANVTGAGALEAELIGARVLGVEQFDGQQCDLVEFYFSKNIVKFSETTGAPEVVDEQRYTETVHFARADGLPRRVVTRDIATPGTPPGSGSTITAQFLKMKVNPGYEAPFFDLSIPGGYQPQPKK